MLEAFGELLHIAPSEPLDARVGVLWSRIRCVFQTDFATALTIDRDQNGGAPATMSAAAFMLARTASCANTAGSKLKRNDAGASGRTAAFTEQAQKLNPKDRITSSQIA